MSPTHQRSVAKQVVLGLLIGTAVAIFPFELAFLGGCLALIFLCVRKYWFSLGVIVVVATSAIQIPLGDIHGRVDPFAYGPMHLENLKAKLNEEQGVFVIIEPKIKTNLVTFTVDRRMSRREVVRKLASETGMELRFRSCASGGTLLFGCHTAAYLRPAE